MAPRQKTAVALLAAGPLLGVAADALFDGRPVGVNAAVFAFIFVGALAVLLRIGEIPLHQGRRLMVIPLLLFAGLLALRDSPLLLAANLVAIAGAISLGALRRTARKVHAADISDYVAGGLSAGAAAFGGAIELMEKDVPWRDLGAHARSRQAASVGRGLAIGVPLLFVFGGLFVAADAVFESFLLAAVPSPGRLLLHAATILGVGWLSAGLLRDLLAERDDERVAGPVLAASARVRLGIGATEVAVVLGILDVLFAAFVAVQARYLFGGAGLVESRLHLTYAQYARHGFFELVAVALLVLPLLLIANGVVRNGDRGARLVRGLSAGLIALALVVMASALDRMWLYEKSYGLTELRIYATGIIFWLACVLVWMLATVVRGRRRTFATGAVLAGFAATLALNAIDPDALIARVNLSRPHLDAAYVGSLSDDAVPVLLARLPTLAPPARARIAAALLGRNASGSGLLGWNASRSRAHSLLAESRPELERYLDESRP